MGTAAVVVVAILAGFVALSLSMLVWFRWRRTVTLSRLRSELAADNVVRPPEMASYRGATVIGYPGPKNDGVIALTRQRLMFQTLTGRRIEVPVADIDGVRTAETFNRAKTSGREHLIIRIPEGEIGFFVADNAAWIHSLTVVGAQPVAAGDPTQYSPALNVDNVLRRRRRTRTILAVVFSSIGIASGSAAGITAAVTAQSISGDRHADGTVVDLSYVDGGYVPVVEFAEPSGTSIRFTGGLGSDRPEFRVGEPVRVRYDPDNPQDAMIDRYWQIWFLPTLLGAFAVPFLLGGVTFAVLTRVTRRKTSAPQWNSSL